MGCNKKQKLAAGQKRGRPATAGTKRLLRWQKKGYHLEGTVSLTRRQALSRAAELRAAGYKARAVKGNWNLYIVAREPYKPHKRRR